MNLDPDLMPSDRSPAQPPLPTQLYQQYQNLPSQDLNKAMEANYFSMYQNQPPGPTVKLVVMAMTIFTALGNLFLIIAAMYSYGLLPASDPQTDGSSKGALFILTMIAGVLAFVTAYIALRHSERLGSLLFDKINKIQIIAIIVLVLLIFIAPVIR